MRHLTLPLFLLLVSATLFAQDRGGNWLIAGNTAAEYQFERSNWDGSIFGDPSPNSEFDQTQFTLTSFRTGYYITNRLLVGGQFTYSRFVTDPADDFFDAEGAFQFRPFVRYHFLDPGGRGPSLFGEAGFGTVGIGDVEDWESTYHVGIGAEVNLTSGVLASANLNYEGRERGLNQLTLSMGPQFITGQLGEQYISTPTQTGTFVTDGQWLNASFGSGEDEGGLDNNLYISFTPRAGYFILPGLLVEAEFVANYNRLEFVDDTESKIRSLGASAGVRYYPLPTSRFSPFLTVGMDYIRNNSEFDFSVNGNPSGTIEIDENPFGWRAGIGASYFLTNHAAVLSLAP
jgi:opacity protein-like surface antigen